jgi:hypothetical protein
VTDRKLEFRWNPYYDNTYLSVFDLNNNVEIGKFRKSFDTELLRQANHEFGSIRGRTARGDWRGPRKHVWCFSQTHYNNDLVATALGHDWEQRLLLKNFINIPDAKKAVTGN